MAKISFDYMIAADKMAEKGEYESALHYYFLERNSRNDSDIDVCIGDTYAAMGLPREAIKHYMTAYAADRYNKDALEGLIVCYKDIDEDAAFYYLHCVLGQDGEEFDDFGVDYEPEYPPLTVHDKKDKSEVMDEAVSLLESGNIDGAKELLESINRESYQYCDALLARASLAMDKANTTEAMALADEALSVNPDHLGTHILKIMVYDSLGDKANAEEWIAKLDALNPKQEDEVTKVALCLANYKNTDLAEKYILRKLEFAPYDKLMLMCLSAIYAGKGDEHSAFKIANKVCSIYPNDIAVKEITSRIFSGQSIKMPDEMFYLKRDWTKDIKQMFLEDIDSITQPESIKKIKWLLQNDDDLYLQSAVCALVTGMPEYDNLMNEILIDPFAPAIVKKQILLRRICDERTKKVKFVISNIFRSLKVKHPVAPDNLKYAYYYAFIALAVIELTFERRLNREFKRLHEKYEICTDESKEQLPINALATHLFYMTEGGIKERCLELFDCEQADFDKVSEMLGLQGRD
ncbi:MAG: hypothetical protein J1F36_01350 [Clostridiales bacterium]|nr:hypothetical protein [Clostridiales bacterium]